MRNNCKDSKNKTNRGGSKRPNTRKQTNVVDKQTTEVRGTVGDSRDNDINWYNKNPELLKASCSVSFGQRAGFKIGMEKTPTIPGVMSLYWMPSIGNGSPSRVAQDNLYSYVVHANSRNTSYDPVDLMMYVMGADSVFSLIGSLIRVYGIMRNFDGFNDYTPYGLIESMGFDYADLKANYHHMLADINQLIAQSRTIWVPNNIPYLARHFWLSTNVYKDGSSPKSQFYIFNQCTYLQYNPTGTEAGGTLDPKKWSVPTDTRTKWSTLVTNVQSAINALRDADAGTMSGDILKAYGPESIYKINYITEDYTVTPIEDEEVLTQIHNANAIGVPLGKFINQDGYILEESYSSTTLPSNLLCTGSELFDFFKRDNPTPEEVMIASRLSQREVLCSKVNEKYLIDVWNSGSERIYLFCIYQFTADNKFKRYAFHTNNDTAKLQLDLLSAYTMFDWAPLIYEASVDTNKMKATAKAVFGDVENCVSLDAKTMARMHECALLSEFDVPAM